MTAAAPSPAELTGARERSRAGRLLDHPLASYHLVSGVTALLLVFGLVMVLSSSTVTSISRHGSAFFVFDNQVRWALIGGAVFLMARRMPVRFFRVVGYPA